MERNEIARQLEELKDVLVRSENVEQRKYIDAVNTAINELTTNIEIGELLEAEAIKPLNGTTVNIGEVTVNADTICIIKNPDDEIYEDTPPLTE